MASQRLFHATGLANRDNSQPNEPNAGAHMATIGDGVSRPSKRSADVEQKTCHFVPYFFVTLRFAVDAAGDGDCLTAHKQLGTRDRVAVLRQRKKSEGRGGATIVEERVVPYVVIEISGRVRLDSRALASAPRGLLLGAVGIAISMTGSSSCAALEVEEMKCKLTGDVAMVGGGSQGGRETGGSRIAAAAVATHSRSPQAMPAGGEAGGGDANARVASTDLPLNTTSAGLSGCACSRAAARAPPHLTSPRPHHSPG